MTASEGTSKFIVWERSNKTGKWIPYSSEIAQLLENCYAKQLETVSLGEVEDSLKIFSIHFEDMVQISEKTGTKSKVRRQLYSNIDSLSNGYTWQWSGSDKENWHSYDIDVNNFIETAFQSGSKSVTLKKTFKGYNYEIDFSKMLQINKQTKRKRPIRRQHSLSLYPVEQCSGSVQELEAQNSIDKEYPGLSQEVPGTSALIQQLNSYVQGVTMEVRPDENEPASVAPLPPSRKRNKKQGSAKMVDDDNQNLSVKPCLSSTATYAIVNGMPWHHSQPPHTPASLIKPVPGIEPLPKSHKKAAKKKKASPENYDVDIFEVHCDEVPFDSLNGIHKDEVCIICCEELSKKSCYKDDPTVVKLKLCSHLFHKACLEAMYNSGSKDCSLQCPTCKKIHGEKCGIQPPGDMVYHVLPYSLPSFPDCDTIRIIYNFSSGIQGAEHPNPGKKYTARGFPRHCYLPDNEMGRKVLRLLTKAWRRRLVFTVGRSSTTGEENTVTWNEIHHKTEFGCNRRGHGFPDPNYYRNVLAELEAHGVKDDDTFLWYPAS